MSNYICRTVNELPDYIQALFIVPTGEKINTGEIYNAETMAINGKGILEDSNYQVYIPEIMFDNEDIPAIILNNGFESLKDGRRISGNPDYSQYSYEENEVITAIRLYPEIKLELSADCLGNFEDYYSVLGNEDIKDTYIYPELETNKLVWTDNFSEVNTKVYLVVETADKHFRNGGNFGDKGIDTMIVRVKHQKIQHLEPNPPIDSIEVTPFATSLNLPLEVGKIIANVEIVGGTSPFTGTVIGFEEYFELEEHSRHNFNVVVKKPYYENENFDIVLDIYDHHGEEGGAIQTINVQPSPMGEITSVVESGLSRGSAKVAPGATVVSLYTGGQTAPFTYSFNDVQGNNNLRFRIIDNKIQVGNTALEGGSYFISVKSTDRYGQEKTKNIMLMVAIN